MRGHVQKSGVHPGVVGYPAINPGRGKQNAGAGRPEAELGHSPVHPSGSGTCSLEQGHVESWRGHRALLAFPLTSASIMSADVLRNWILDSWAGKDRDNRITALPVTSTHTRRTEMHSRCVSSKSSRLRAAAEPSRPRVTTPQGHVGGPLRLWPLQPPRRAPGSSQQHTPNFQPPRSSET